MEVKNIKKQIEKATIAVATINKNNKPHAIAIMYAKVEGYLIIITDNYMKKTIENIKNNQYVSLVFWQGEQGWRIDGKAEYYNSGKWLNYVKSLKENKGLPAKGVIVIKTEKITDLG